MLGFLFETGAEGQNRMRLRRNTGIFRLNFLNSENAVITSSWFYSDFSGYFWIRLELFGNIWPWRAQFGHNLAPPDPPCLPSLHKHLTVNNLQRRPISSAKKHKKNLYDGRNFFWCLLCVYGTPESVKTKDQIQSAINRILLIFKEIIILLICYVSIMQITKYHMR